jgi:glucosyl-3-phosphoglycerate synthase
VLPQTVADWLVSHTSATADWQSETLRQQPDRPSIAVVLPALNEAATVGTIVTAIREAHTGVGGLVSEVVVIDSGSTDATAEVAAAAGARVVSKNDVLPGIPVAAGKGEAMWRGVAATTAELVVFVDADLQSFTPDYITALVGPLLADDRIQLVKAIYERPLVAGDHVVPAGGGRVTELVARPLLNQFWPELTGVVQPLAGEYAARRTLLESLPFPTGYGVEFALMVDTYERHGLAALAQVDLGVRVHRHHNDQGLGVMAAEILATAIHRTPGGAVPRNPTSLTQFERTGDGYLPHDRPLATDERPPLRSLEY